jgi:hypothetical protein
LLGGLFRRLTATSLPRLTGLFLNEAFLAAPYELIQSNFAILVGIDHQEIDNERCGRILRESNALTLDQAPNSFAFLLVKNCTRTP